MPFDSIISRTDADSLIPKDVAGELISAATQESAALTTLRPLRSGRPWRDGVVSSRAGRKLSNFASGEQHDKLMRKGK